jgi:hypothetical protein
VVRLATHAHYRVSKRGLVLAGATGETVLFEHPRADVLPDFLAEDLDRTELEARLGPPLDPDVIADLVALNILTDSPPAGPNDPGEAPPRSKRFTLSRSGLMITGIATPARVLNHYLVPVLLHPIGKLLIGATVIAGATALIVGRPDLPWVSTSPAIEALLMIVLGMIATICHELAHAVALVHYDRTPRRAGFGFYWGSLSFFVDSTPALTLPRNPRVIQALVGLGVDAVTTSLLAVAAHFVPNQLLAIVFWRLAILGVIDIAINLAPILQVDGHWALADWLDEPDLSPRARRALGAALRRRLPRKETWLALYGAFSLLAGLALLTVLVLVFWANTSDLIISLFTGSATDIIVGIYYVAPLIIGIILSALGLLLEPLLAMLTPTPSNDAPPAADRDTPT